MGYVHDTGFTQVIPPVAMFGDTATWTLGAGQVSNSFVYKCDATDEVANVWIPIPIPSNSGVDAGGNAVKGSKLKSIEIDYEIVTAACDSVTATIYKAKRGVEGAVVVMSTPTFTQSPTAANSKTADQHKLVLTLDTPVYIENDEYFFVKIAFDKAATSTVEILGAFANYNFRA